MAVFTIYDNTTNTGTILYSTGTMAIANQSNNLPFDVVGIKGMPFFTGLTFEITTANCNVTITYE